MARTIIGAILSWALVLVSPAWARFQFQLTDKYCTGFARQHGLCHEFIGESTGAEDDLIYTDASGNVQVRIAPQLHLVQVAAQQQQGVLVRVAWVRVENGMGTNVGAVVRAGNWYPGALACTNGDPSSAWEGTYVYHHGAWPPIPGECWNFFLPTAAEQTSIAAWLAGGPNREIVTEVVVDHYYQYGGTCYEAEDAGGLNCTTSVNFPDLPHTSTHWMTKAARYHHEGCQVSQSSSSLDFFFLLPVLLLLLVLRQRGAVIAVVALLLLWGQIVFGQALPWIHVGTRAEADQFLAYWQPGTGGGAAGAWQLPYGSPVTTGEPSAEGCMLPTITVGSSSDLPPLSHPVTLHVTEDCTVYVTYDSYSLPESPADMTTEPVGGGAGSPGCFRQATASITTYNEAFSVWHGLTPQPAWWLSMFALPMTRISVDDYAVDFGNHSEFDPSSTPNAWTYAFAPLGWSRTYTYEGFPSEVVVNRVPAQDFVQGSQAFVMRGTVFTQMLLSPPSGYAHLLNVAVDQRPMGWVRSYYEVQGEFPNQRLSVGGTSFQMPWTAAIVGYYRWEYGDYCPLAWQEGLDRVTPRAYR